ncbi:MFS general substrate transporter [Coniophora puteana RWD-64-598 SS2]|uniref:MFS general substrate transporter n=1 Tax=Coniophora puteana (strain RWD-64-598) TaxID=741705 RepID=A0A5M3MR42_CONPW|nr:MFS general substrate transporter [Coniophora puteana RWD-64-598 SS2]EIW81214.1 MFS general substrate transporter [Coniophora puteana RWD-64-598 SS2]
MDSTDTIDLAARTPLPYSSSDESLASERLADTSAEEGLRNNESSLAPVDGGFGAWSFLAGAFMVETIVWGFSIAYGSFLSEYLADTKYASQSWAATGLPLVGPLSSGIMYCSGFFLYPTIARYPFARRPMMWAGTAIMFLSLFIASYTTKIVELIILQGCLYGIGGAIVYAPTISYLSEWFVTRRGMANGVIFAGTAAGGLLLPLIVPHLIASYGIQKALRILAIASTIALVPALPFIKGRLPESRVAGPRARSSGYGWMRNETVWFVLAANTLQGFGYFVPTVWLPTFASDLGLSSANASLMLALLNGSSVVGRIGLGYLSDRTDPWILAMITLSLASVSSFVLWGVLSNSLAGLLAFGIAYGSIAGGWSSLWTGFIKPIAKDDLTLSTSLYGYLLFSRGLGNVLSTPISTSLSSGYGSGSGQRHIKTGFDVAGGKFEKMIVYVGACFAGATLVVSTQWALRRMKSSS